MPKIYIVPYNHKTGKCGEPVFWCEDGTRKDDLVCVVPTEDKPIKVIFEGESVNRFMVDSWTKNHPLSKAVNDSVDALVDAWKGFAKSFHSIYDKDTLEYNTAYKEKRRKCAEELLWR